MIRLILIGSKSELNFHLAMKFNDLIKFNLQLLALRSTPTGAILESDWRRLRDYS